MSECIHCPHTETEHERTEDGGACQVRHGGWGDLGLLDSFDTPYEICLCPGFTRAFADQEFVHDPVTGSVGDCWRACIASILGYSRELVPHFIGDHFHEEGTEWFQATNSWLQAQTGETILYYPGAEAVRSSFREGSSSRPYLIVNGRSPRGEFNHCIVGDVDTGALIHDPHPSRAGVLDVTGAFVFCGGDGDA